MVEQSEFQVDESSDATVLQWAGEDRRDTENVVKVSKLMVKDSTYTQWSYESINLHESPSPNFEGDIRYGGTGEIRSEGGDKERKPPCPLVNKWFHNDLIDLSTLSCPRLIHSPVRTAKYIPGILILDGNKTFGRTSNAKRLLYRCIPDDKHLPPFFVPYDIKVGFSKSYINKCVLFRFDEWTGQHPHGILVETLGDVNQLEVFYEYQLYLKSLNSSLKDMTQKIKDMTKKKSLAEYFEQIQSNPSYKIRDTTIEAEPPQIFTIDPYNTVDFDDGLSITTCPTTPTSSVTQLPSKLVVGGCNPPEQDICVTVYIANVVFWLELFQLWNSFDNRIATIYLPDRRRPMLPTILSESLCSLKEHTKRFAVAVHFYIRKTNTGEVWSAGRRPATSNCEGASVPCNFVTGSVWTIDYSRTTIENVVISPYKNYVYEDTKMIFQDVNYIRLFETTVRMDSHIKNSSEMVTYWMIKTNTFMAQYMIQHKTGIFRVGKYVKRLTVVDNTNESDQEDEPENESSTNSNYNQLDNDTKRFIEYNAKAESVCYDETLNLEHELLNKKAYLRITSVIRRYEDVCNECELMRIMGIKLRYGEILTDYFNEKLFNHRYQCIRRVESVSVMMKYTWLGENRIKGVLYSRRLLEDGRYLYKVYVKGEGIQEIKTREKIELYKECDMNRYIKEKGGGLKLKIELSTSREIPRIT